jgi:regulatory protein
MRPQQGADDKERAKNRALRLLALRSRSVREVANRLLRAGFERETVDQVVADLLDAGLLDDSEFAREWVEWRTRARPKARRLIKAELARFGLAKEVIDSAVARIDDQAEFEAALRLAEDRLGRIHEDDERKSRQKLAAYLSRRGYRWEVVSAVVRRVLPDGD